MLLTPLTMSDILTGKIGLVSECDGLVCQVG